MALTVLEKDSSKGVKRVSREMRIGLVSASLVLFVASLFGVYQAFSRPTATEEPLMLEYRHEGRFDYLAYSRPSYVYGTSESPLASSRYPIKLIESLHMTYSYHPDETAPQEVEVTAVLENPGVWQKIIVLVPKATRTGDFTLSFTVDLAHFLEVARTIEEEIGVSRASGYDVTIVASVSDAEADDKLTSQDSSHALPMKLTGYFIDVSGDLVHRYGDSYGEFDYTVQLRQSTLFDSTTLNPPKTPEDVSTKTLGPEDTVFLKLLDGMVFSFSHWLQADVPIILLEEEVEITATIEFPGKWSRVIVLVPTTKTSGPLAVSFPLDLRRFTETLDTVQRETGISASARSLTINARVRTLAQTELGLIDDEFAQSMVTDLSGDVLRWSSDLEKSEPRSLETTQTTRKQEKYLGILVAQARVLFSSLAGIILVLFGFSLLLYFRPRPGEPTEIERRAERAAKKYKDIIVDTKDLPVVVPGENVVLLDSLDDLIKAAQGLLKPVLHKTEEGRHVYYVLDAATRYEYVLTGETASKSDTPRKEA